MTRESTMLLDGRPPEVAGRPVSGIVPVLDPAPARPAAVTAPSPAARAVGDVVLRVGLASLSLLLAVAAVAVTAGLLVFELGVGAALLLEPLEVAPALVRPSWGLWTAAAGILSAVDAAAFVLAGAGRAATAAVSAIGAAGLGGAVVVSGGVLQGPWSTVLLGCAVAQLLLAVALQIARTSRTRQRG